MPENDAAAAASAAPQEIEIKTETGQVFKGTPEQVMEQMRHSIEEGSRMIKTHGDQLESLGTEVAGLREQLAPKPPAGEFDRDKYHKLLISDPVDAQNYMDSFRYGVADGRSVVSAIQQMAVVTKKVEDAGAVQDFYRVMDRRYGDRFEESPELAELILKQLVEDQGVKSEREAIISAQSLEGAFDKLVEKGNAKLKEPSGEPRGPKIPPRMRTGGEGGPAETSEVDLLRMSDADFEKKLAQAGLR